MTWLKLGDEYADDCAEVGLSSDAFRLHTEALGWTMKRLSDGVIQRHELRRLTGIEDEAVVHAAVKELVSLAWWTPLDEPDGWLILRHMDKQRTRAQVEDERAAAARRQAVARSRRASRRESQEESRRE